MMFKIIYADDGFGNMLYCPDDAFLFNLDELAGSVRTELFLINGGN